MGPPGYNLIPTGKLLYISSPAARQDYDSFSDDRHTTSRVPFFLIPLSLSLSLCVCVSRHTSILIWLRQASFVEGEGVGGARRGRGGEASKFNASLPHVHVCMCVCASRLYRAMARLSFSAFSFSCSLLQARVCLRPRGLVIFLEIFQGHLNM